MAKPNLKKKCRAFNTYPSQIYALESKGVLPQRERGRISREWLCSLTAWHQRARGQINPEIKKIIQHFKNEGKENGIKEKKATVHNDASDSRD